jgi:PAS domain S-box-containing protein
MNIQLNSDQLPEPIGINGDMSAMTIFNAIKDLPLFVLAVETSGNIIFANSKASEIFGPSDFSGKEFHQVFRPVQGNDAFDQINHSLATDGNWTGELRIDRPDGEQILVELIAHRTVSDLGQLNDIYLGQDISSRRLQERQNFRIEKSAVRSEMAGEISHELNNYLSIVRGNLELMGMAVDKGKIESLGPRLKSMKDGLGRIAKFVEGLMSLCQTDPRVEAFHIQSLLDEEIFFLKRDSRFHGVEFSCQWDDNLPPIEANRSRIKQALVNILTNAADAVANNAPGQRNITISIAHTEPEPMIHLSIWDNGPGMSEEDYQRAFRQFFTTKGPGHGFGLLSIKGGIKSQGGKVAVSSGPDGGACFAIELPRQAAVQSKPQTVPA